MGEYDDVAHLRNELKHVKEAQDNGDVWYPMF